MNLTDQLRYILALICYAPLPNSAPKPPSF